jgi:TPP-dependent trihydroxycyclohexane-1,2-dione (THcHDO) dehydratase
MSKIELEKLWFAKTFCKKRLPFMRQEYPSAKSLAKAMRAFVEVNKRVALSEGVLLADAESVVDKNLENFIDDVHYTQQGAGILAENVAKTIIESGIIEKRKNNR